MSCTTVYFKLMKQTIKLARHIINILFYRRICVFLPVLFLMYVCSGLWWKYKLLLIEGNPKAQNIDAVAPVIK